MSIHGIRRALRIPRFTRRLVEREIDDEFADHIARRAEQLRATGMTLDAARAEAERRFGDARALRGECVGIDAADLRRENVMDFLDNTRSDVAFAFRLFRRSPGFTAVALGTLTMGIAAFTAIFSFFNAVYYASLPYRDADRIVAIDEERQSIRFFSFSSVSLEALPFVRGATRSFERISAYGTNSATLVIGHEPRPIATLDVDTAFIPLLALSPQVGRLITADEIAADAPVAMISDVLWRSTFGGDASVIGRRLTMRGRDYTIVGVLPPGFRFPWQTDAIAPLHQAPEPGLTARETTISLLGKLRPGVTREDARTELGVIAGRIAAIDRKGYRGERLVVRDEMLDRRTYQFLPMPSLFLGAGLFLLLIACANVGNLVFARAAERAGEMAIRASLGAGRGRLVRLALTETLLLSAIAALFGMALAQALVKLWLHFVPTTGFPSWFHVAVDWRVVTFAVVTTAVATIAVGLSPALAGSRFDLVRTLKGASGGGISAASAMRGSKRGLVVQLALSVALFVGGALLLRSYQQLAAVDIGYPADRIALVRSFYDVTAYGSLRSARAQQAAENAIRRAMVMPGVTGAAIRGGFSRFRTEPETLSRAARLAERRQLIPDGDTTRAVRRVNWESQVVSDGFFDLLGLRIRSGRSFGTSDVAGAQPVAIVGESTARALWGSTNPIGRSLQLRSSGPSLLVVGVVEDARRLRGGSRGYSLDPGLIVYLSSRQAVTRYPELLARGAGSVISVRRTLVDALHDEDPTAYTGREISLASQFDEAFLVTKVFGSIIGALAGAALMLSVVGIYGVVAFGVAQRTREIGIRIALGGTPDTILRMIAGEAGRFVSIGLVVGLLLATGLARLMKIFLFGVSPLDPLTYVAVSALFGVVAFVACIVPARRVTRVDPMVALRTD